MPRRSFLAGFLALMLLASPVEAGGSLTLMAVGSAGAAAPVDRIFTCSPACNGNATWDLDTQGQLVLNNYTGTLTPNKTFTLQVELYGPGAGSGGVGATVATAGGTGTAATFNGMTANGGVGSVGVITNAAAAGGIGGTATGGSTTNSTGISGTTGTIGATSTGGTGGGGLSGGGASQPGASSGTTAGVAGINGNAPGGGAGGAARGGGGGNPRSTGGGGEGGYSNSAAMSVTGGVPLTLTVPSGAAAGTGDVQAGGAGTNGQAKFT